MEPCDGCFVRPAIQQFAEWAVGTERRTVSCERN
jgi:hypothetical protein